MSSPPTRRRPDTLRSIYYALGANLGITVIKFCGAAYTGSGSLLAESFHSLADSGNELLLLLGRKQAGAPPTVRHPLGHGRATYFWSFIVTLLLFSLGGLFSIYEGYTKLRAQHAVETPWIAVAIVVIAMILEGVSLRVTLQQIAEVRGNTSLFRWFRDTRRGELIIVLGEDIAAIAGLSLALAALLVTIAKGNALYDAIGSIGIGAGCAPSANASPSFKRSSPRQSGSSSSPWALPRTASGKTPFGEDNLLNRNAAEDTRRARAFRSPRRPRAGRAAPSDWKP